MTQSMSEMPSANRGDAFQEAVATWLSRRVPERAQNQCFDFPAILSTDIGLQREENQDRVAALRLSARHSSQPIIAVVIADGMGGMRDGAKCATLAVSSFFYALVRHRHQGLEQRAAAATAHANDTVFAFANGRGGATLSALLFDEGAPPVIVNLGDSRIYACGKGIKVERLTIDDSLEEAVGGHGRELLQFVGMGPGMQPHIRTVPSGVTELALTTDGIHYIDADTLAKVLFHAPEPKAASERLSALARWCGGHDNASIALIDLKALRTPAVRNHDAGIQVWDPFGTMAITWLRDPGEAPPLQAAAPSETAPLQANPEQRGSDRRDRKGSRRSAKKARQGQSPPKEDVQLEIKIEKSSDVKDGDDDSR
ncbi:serine/threonine-protein phosphatase [Methylosinus sporium]|uniref:Serine/threonine-protein phosphatase n=1 Tax=Methylosinus sporium TaxID=428 RepID=A0A549SMI2_METSR|nr:protein phosphatase 2C domain-containing protein [Methylosinus sporium]TRL30838.1 serine/threonine-protein phosphatase [Methylosinus sporium]